MHSRTSRALVPLYAAAAAVLLSSCLPAASAIDLPRAAAPSAAATSTAPAATSTPPAPTSDPTDPTPVDAAPDPDDGGHGGHGADHGPLPEGVPGTTERLVGPDDRPAPVDDGTGAAFRIICDFTHMAADDPIVKPGQPGASHLHTFFGNAAVDAFTTADDLRDEPRSACRGGSVNASGYWVPTVLDADGEPVAPVHSEDWREAGERDVHFHPNNFYYKRTFAPEDRTIVAPPPGFRMIVGDATATAPQEGRRYAFRCEGDGETPKGEDGEIPRCAQGQLLVLSIVFPDCWDGVNLDSPDHTSHVAFGGRACPDTHPVRIPTITMNVRWPVWDHPSTEGWRLSSDADGVPGGLSAHADWFNGWEPGVLEGIVEDCLNKGVNCGNQRLGQGEELLPIPRG